MRGRSELLQAGADLEARPGLLRAWSGLRKIKLSPQVQGTIWFLCMVFYLMTMFALAFQFTSWMYEVLHVTPSPLALQLINSFLGLVLMVASVAAISRVFRSKIAEGQIKLFSPIIDAMQRIAKGDFSARVDPADPNTREGGMINDLVRSVNSMATDLHQWETTRQEFVSNVSHEIQSPLTSIRGFAQALQDDDLSIENRRHYLSIIETESMRLSKLTDNLLKLASLEADHVRFEPQPYRLDRQIRTLILACEPQWMGKSLEMDVSLEEATLSADEDLLSQVWVNLIYNAIKFTPQGGRLCIALCRKDDGFEFTIEDTGIGISEEDREHIFERFYKADKSRTRGGMSGSGLGLSIAQKIVEMHKGHIIVTSTPGTGTTFVVTLPAS